MPQPNDVDKLQALYEAFYRKPIKEHQQDVSKEGCVNKKLLTESSYDKVAKDVFASIQSFTSI